MIEPIATATTKALTKLTTEALEGLDETDLEQLSLPGMEELPAGFSDMLKQFMSQDPGQFLAPAARALAGLQAGQVFGELAGRLLYQHEFTLPSASHTDAYVLMGNITASFDGYGLDMRDVTVAIALEEAAFRRVFHAIPWLNTHITGLFTTFAAGITFDRDLLEQLSREFIGELDVTDEEGLREAMERAAHFTVPPTKEQQAVIDQLHVVLGVVGAWARREAFNVAQDRIPTFATITEVLRRRRATRGDGEKLLAQLLGLDLKPADETVGEAFIAVVEDALGEEGLHRAL
ncbi:MAG: zinc-dependent metalloprotease, partial [Phycisphaeraceae bacterium]